MDQAGAAVRLTPAQEHSPPDASWRYSEAEASEVIPGLPREFAAYRAEPLAQRPAGSVGKRGVCALSFAVEQERTVLRYSFVSHPFHLTRPWYMDPALPGMAVVYVQTPAGGLIQGDRTCLRLALGPAAQVHLTNQAAEKIHTMTANCALQQISFVLGAGAYAEYCPEPVILFARARFGQELTVELEEKASFFLSEIFLSRRSVDSASFDALATGLRVRDASGTLMVRDRSLVLPVRRDLAGPGILGPHLVWGQALLVGPPTPSAWAQDVYALISTEPGVICGATVLPGERGIGIKAVGADVRAVRHVLQTAWHYLRTRHLGAPSPVFPK